MSNTSPTIRELLDHPDVSGLVDPVQKEGIAAALSNSEQAVKDPLYIRILSGIGAWFAAFFLIAFLGISGIITNETGAVVCGIAFLVAAVVLTKTCKATFPTQLALVLAFAGNIMTLVGICEYFHFSHGIVPALSTHAAICAVMYILYPSSVYRFCAPVVLAVIATIWITEMGEFWFLNILIAAETLLAGLLILHTRRTLFLQPLIRAAAVTLPATLLFMNLAMIDIFHWRIWESTPNSPLGVSSAVLAAGLVYMFFRLAGGINQYRQPWLIMAVIATVLLGIFTNPGVLVAIGLLTAGYAYGDRILTALAYLFLPCFLVGLYYVMDVTLACKSAVIAGSGLILLILRWILIRNRSKEAQT